MGKLMRTVLTYGLPIGAGLLILSSRRAKASTGSGSGSLGNYPYPPPKSYGVAQAAGSSAPLWPISPDSKRKPLVHYRDINGKWHGNMARAFHAERGDGTRWHAGIDINANAGDVVLAPEGGRIVADQNFLDTIPGKDAFLLQGDNGVTILIGEIVAKSYRDFGHEVGDYVNAGEPIARIAKTSNDSHMLHFETYKCCPTHNNPWWQGSPPPDGLLDPTDYLLRALAGREA